MAKFWALNNFFYLIPYYIKWFFSTLKTSPFDSIWLEISTNWHNTSQGPKKKSIKITKGRIDPCPAHTARNKGSFTTMVLWIAQRFLSSTVCRSIYGPYLCTSVQYIYVAKLHITDSDREFAQVICWIKRFHMSVHDGSLTFLYVNEIFISNQFIREQGST